MGCQMFPEAILNFFGNCCSCIGFKRVIFYNMQRLWFEEIFLSSCAKR